MAQVESKDRHQLPGVLRQHSASLPDEQWQSKGLLKMAADVIDNLSTRSETVPINARRYEWLRQNGDKGIYVLQRWTQGDEHSPLALAQGAELDTIVDEFLEGKRT